MLIDRYTKAVLTVIALCLVWLCTRDLTIIPAVSAQSDVVKVQIVSIDESPTLRWEAIPVRVR